MKKFIQLVTIQTLLLVVTLLATSCEKDEDTEPTNTGEQGSFSFTLSGDEENNLNGVAAYEIDEGILRINLGDNPPDIVMNYSLGTDETLIPTGIYDPVSATGTGMPENSIAVQYNGTETYFGEEGTVEITESESGTITGTIDAVLESIGGSTINVEGDFTATP